MRIILTAASYYTEPGLHLNTSPNLGLYQLAAIARANGHQVEVVDPKIGPSRLDQDEFIRTFAGADLIGVSSTSALWPETLALMDRLNMLPARPLMVAGGAHASILDEHALRRGKLDYVVRGEGDHAFPELLSILSEGRDPQGMPGVSCLRKNELSRGPDRPLIPPEELARIPVPAYESIPKDYYKVFPIESSRGCLHRCVFCSITHPRTFRDMGPARFKAAIDQAGIMIDSFKERTIHLVDDCFLTRGRDLAELGKAVSGLGIPLAMSTRVSNLLDEEVLDFYARLPVAICEIGIECGYPEGIKKVGKGISIQQVEGLARQLKERGLIDRVLFAYVVGFPWESKKECLTTVKFAFDLAHRYGGRIQIGWFVLYPGSEIYHHPERYGVALEESDYDRFAPLHFRELFMRMRPRLSEKDVADVEYAAKFLSKAHPDIKAFLMMG